MKNEILELNKENIKDKIHIIRNRKVMIDSDLAEIYGYDIKNFNRQVKNNIEKFDEDFMFQITDEEYLNLRCNFCTSRYLATQIYSRHLRSIFLTSSCLLAQNRLISKNFEVLRSNF